MNTKDQPKYRAIAEDLRQAIVDKVIPVGKMLPSHSELVDKYGASVCTIRQAINYMAMQGWVRAEQGKGVIVLDSKDRVSDPLRTSTVGFAVFGPCVSDDATQPNGRLTGNHFASHPVNTMVLHGATEFLQDNGKEVLYGLFPPGCDGVDRFDRFLDRVSSVLVFGDYQQDVLDTLRHRGVRAVLLGETPAEGINCDDFFNVYVDHVNAGYLAGQALAIHNHKHVAFVGQLRGRPHETVKEGFDKACQQYQLDCRFDLSFQNADEWQLADQLAADPECTGIVAFGDGPANRLERALGRLGLEVPQDKSIVAIGGIPQELMIGPSHVMTHVDCQFEELGCEGARLLLSDANSALHKATPVLFDRGGTLRML